MDRRSNGRDSSTMRGPEYARAVRRQISSYDRHVHLEDDRETKDRSMNLIRRRRRTTRNDDARRDTRRFPSLLLLEHDARPMAGLRIDGRQAYRERNYAGRATRGRNYGRST